jgi:hypothetical protein
MRETTEERARAAMDMALHLARPCASPSLRKCGYSLAVTLHYEALEFLSSAII